MSMSVETIRALAESAIDSDIAYHSGEVTIDWEFYNAVIDLADEWAEWAAERSVGSGPGQRPEAGSPATLDGPDPTPTVEDCACCGFMARPRNPDPWEGRLDGYCTDCAHARCDADPGACGKNGSS